MSDKKSKLKLPAHKQANLKGFEDVIDIFLEEQEAEERDKNKKEFEKHSSTHELFDFLEKEKNRLDCMDKFFAEKLPNLMNNPQIDLLLKNQNEKAFFKRDEVIKAIKAPKSDFINYISRVFDQSFG
ncbi:MAG: hypothetical protein KC493_06730 [Bacteriovoracaceae bacterium]|nr:hypothetical protein [Bacteriovoracaceae bacterium]